MLCSNHNLNPKLMFEYLSTGRRRQMDAYVDDLFDPVLDQGPPVSDAISSRYYLNCD